MGATLWRYELFKGKLYCALLGDRVHRGVSPAERQPESSRAARRREIQHLHWLPLITYLLLGIAYLKGLQLRGILN